MSWISKRPHNGSSSSISSSRLRIGGLLIIGLLMCLLQTADCQFGQNSPPVMYIERDWKLAEDEPNGTVVARVQAHDDNGDTLLFGLEPHQVIHGDAVDLERLPFRINERTGVVYLNESLAGRGGQVFSIYVTVSDGVVELKNEVYVHVLGDGGAGAGVTGGGGGGTGLGGGSAFGGSFTPHVQNVTDLFPAFGKLPGVNGNSGGGGSLPPGIFGGGSSSSHRQTHTYPTGNGGGGGGYTRPSGTNVHKNDVDNAAAAAAPDNNHNNVQHADDNATDDDAAAAAAAADGTDWPTMGGVDKNHSPGGADYPQVYTYSNNRGGGGGGNHGMHSHNKNGSKTTVLTPAAVPPPSSTPGPAAGNATPTGTHNSNAAADEQPAATSTATPASLTLILAICGFVILAAGLAAAYMCRPYLCAWGRRIKTKSKEEMAKKSNASTVSGLNGTGPMGRLGTASSLSGTEDSRNSMVMQTWNGPRAFSNRYVPWERDGNPHAQVSPRLSNASSTGTSILKSDRWEFPRHRLKFFNVLGQGAFGLVWRCEAIDLVGNEGISVVAVKTLKENASDIEIKDLNSELQVMKTLEPHVNVVRLLGCCTDKDPIFVILEYVNRGKLQDYLRNSRAEKHYGNAHGKSNTLTSGDLTSFMYQVARGMEYLSSRGIIHRDLAARNILITDDHTCKVADFGFARDVVTSKVYERKSEGKLPIRWMAIESLYDNLFSVKSDIWSFGILMWEIVTLGSTPYPGIAASDVMRKVRDGYRLEKPEHCRRELYNIMYYCWARDFKDRPVFGELVELLDKLLVTEMDYIELERFPDHNYYNMSSLSGEKL